MYIFWSSWTCSLLRKGLVIQLEWSYSCVEIRAAQIIASKLFVIWSVYHFISLVWSPAGVDKSDSHPESPFSSPHLWLWSTRDSDHTQHIPDPLLCYSTCICRVSFSVMRRVLKVHGADIIWHPLVGLFEFLAIPVHKKVHPAFSFKISVT
jgi:hypothetical protein